MRDNEDRLTVEVNEGEPVTIVVVGELDPHTAPLLADTLTAVIDGGAEVIRVECDRLEFIDSSGLRVLVDAHRRLGNGREALVLAHPSGTFRRLLEVTGLDEHVTVEPVGS